MKDIQNGPSKIALAIDRVGVKNFKLPLKVRDRAQGSQHTVARVDLYVDLPAKFKGTHMSRLVEALQEWSGDLDYKSFKQLLSDIRARLSAQNAHIRFKFPYFLEKSSPATGSEGLMDYMCLLDGELVGDKPAFTLAVEVPVMTVCPCSLAITETGAHSQRAVVRITARFTGFVWLEELIQIGEDSASSPVYTLLKRQDEKVVTEQAFGKPTFVEDVVRNAAKALDEHARITWYRVEVESFESIHNHNAYASIEKDKKEPQDKPA